MRFVLLLVAAVVAVVAGIFALQWANKQNPPAQQTQGTVTTVQKAATSNVETVDILVAKMPIPMGTTITDAMVDKQPWPQNLVLDGFVVSGAKNSNITGRVARSNFQAREPFIFSKLANPNDPSFLAATLPAGKRAVTLATDAVSGLAGYIFPGDRVDVLLTHNIPREIKERDFPDLPVHTAEKPMFTEVLIVNSRVLAVNVRTPAGKDPAQENPAPSNITIEVDADSAQKIRLAEKLGTLSLALRSLKDKDNNTLDPVTTIDYLSTVKVSTQANSPAGIKIVRGAGRDQDGVNGPPSSVVGTPPPPLSNVVVPPAATMNLNNR